MKKPKPLPKGKYTGTVKASKTKDGRFIVRFKLRRIKKK